MRTLPRAGRSPSRRYARMFHGLGKLSRYALPGVVISLSGCVSHSMLSVSADGRYILAPLNEAGEVGVAEGLWTRGYLLVDRTSGTATRMKLDAAHPTPTWFSVNAGTVALMQAEARDGRKYATVIVHDGRQHVFTEALFPSVSDDGKHVACVVGEMEGGDHELAVVDAATGKLTKLGVKGLMPDISPDGKHILFAEPVGEDTGGKTYASSIVTIDGKEKRRVGPYDPTHDSFAPHPRWVGNDAVLITRHDGEDDEPELYLYTLDGKSSRITSNDAEDRMAQALDKDRIVYLSNPMPDQGDDEDELKCGRPGSLWLATRDGEAWTHRDLGVQAFDFRLVGEKVVYLEKETWRLMEMPLADPAKATPVLVDVKISDGAGHKAQP